MLFDESLFIKQHDSEANI